MPPSAKIPAMDLNGKVALITGGSRGVGAATALQLAKRGCHVAINCSRTADLAKQVAEQCQANGVRAAVVQGDVAADADCRRIVVETIDALGQLDILVNNAGTTRFIDFQNLDDVKDEDWDDILSVNLKGPFQCARAARAALEASDFGVIVNTASVAGMTGVGSSIPYCASKAAVINLTLSMARTLGPKIRVNAVAPGFIEGEWLRMASAKTTKPCERRKQGRDCWTPSAHRTISQTEFSR